MTTVSVARNVLQDSDMALPAQTHGFLIDLDGTVLDGPDLVSGVPEALAFLAARSVPYRLVTNTTSKCE